MRTLDASGAELSTPDLTRGYLRDEKLLVRQHGEIQAVAERGHYETVAEYPNGGKDVAWIIDVPGVERVAAWDEYEDIQRYTEYTAEERAKMAATSTQEERIAELEEALVLLLSGATE